MKDQALIRSLDARYDTDSAVYEAEMRGLFAQTWQFACHLGQIPKIGDYLAFDIAGESLFAIRGGDTQVRCGDFNGFLFVNLDADAAPVEDWCPGVRADLAENVPSIRAFAPLESAEIEKAGNWKVPVETYLECSHCALNNPTFGTGVVRPETYDVQPAHGYVLKPITECPSLDQMSYGVDLSIPHLDECRSLFYWPMCSFCVSPGNLHNTYRWCPRGVYACAVWRCLARLVLGRRRGRRGGGADGQAGLGDDGSGGYPPG